MLHWAYEKVPAPLDLDARKSKEGGYMKKSFVTGAILLVVYLLFSYFYGYPSPLRLDTSHCSTDIAVNCEARLTTWGYIQAGIEILLLFWSILFFVIGFIELFRRPKIGRKK